MKREAKQFSFPAHQHNTNCLYSETNPSFSPIFTYHLIETASEQHFQPYCTLFGLYKLWIISQMQVKYTATYQRVTKSLQSYYTRYSINFDCQCNTSVMYCDMPVCKQNRVATNKALRISKFIQCHEVTRKSLDNGPRSLQFQIRWIRHSLAI